MIKILVVDDKTENSYLLQSLFDTSGFKTISAKNGAEALGLVRNNMPDLIISDILMPVMDGFTFCRECKKDDLLKNIPFFFYTATYTDAKDAEYALGLGADRFILKPQEPDEFIKIINDFLNEIKGKTIRPKNIIPQEEIVVLREYNEVLIRKIEDKMLQTEKVEKELRKYSEQLKKEISLFQTLAEVSPVGIFRTSTSGETTYVNPRWSELSGLTIEEASGDKWLSAVHPDDREKVINNWKSNILLKKPSTAEYRFIQKDGKVVWVFGNAAPELNNGKINGYIGTITDISAIKQYEAELLRAKDKAEESDRLKTAFLHNISHEVRTPMNAIVGFSDLLTDPDLTPETRNEFIHIIVAGSNQLLSIITQIVNMATIEAGLEKIYEKEASLNSIFKMIYDQFITDSKKKNIVLEYKTGLSDDEDMIKTDETKLIQIISNLVSNALKFTRQGTISFGYILKGKYLEFYVKDTGIGIPEDMHQEVFKRFRQVETSLMREYDGAGLGLSISKAYVELLGGKIWLVSGSGLGSEFYFTIPYYRATSDKMLENGPSGYNKTKFINPVTLLIVEDEIINFTLLKHYLSNANVYLIHAANGSEAVEMCKNNRQIDLVLMDLKMPVMDGFEATTKIREFRPDLPVIAQTAYDRDVDKAKALACGCSGFLSKPIRQEELLDSIIKYLG